MCEWQLSGPAATVAMWGALKIRILEFQSRRNLNSPAPILGGRGPDIGVPAGPITRTSFGKGISEPCNHPRRRALPSGRSLGSPLRTEDRRTIQGSRSAPSSLRLRAARSRTRAAPGDGAAILPGAPVRPPRPTTSDPGVCADRGSGGGDLEGPASGPISRGLLLRRQPWAVRRT